MRKSSVPTAGVDTENFRMAYYDTTASRSVLGQPRAVFKIWQIGNVNARFLCGIWIDFMVRRW